MVRLAISLTDEMGHAIIGALYFYYYVFNTFSNNAKMIVKYYFKNDIT